MSVERQRIDDSRTDIEVIDDHDEYTPTGRDIELVKELIDEHEYYDGFDWSLITVSVKDTSILGSVGDRRTRIRVYGPNNNFPDVSIYTADVPDGYKLTNVSTLVNSIQFEFERTE